MTEKILLWSHCGGAKVTIIEAGKYVALVFRVCKINNEQTFIIGRNKKHFLSRAKFNDILCSEHFFFWFENKLNMFFFILRIWHLSTIFSFSLILVFFSNDQLGAYLKLIRQSFYPEKMCRKIVIHILPLVNKTKKLFYFIQSFRFFRLVDLDFNFDIVSLFDSWCCGFCRSSAIRIDHFKGQRIRERKLFFFCFGF